MAELTRDVLVEVEVLDVVLAVVIDEDDEDNEDVEDEVVLEDIVLVMAVGTLFRKAGFGRPCAELPDMVANDSKTLRTAASTSGS